MRTLYSLFYVAGLLFCGFLSLTACQSIEKRSDVIVKRPLPELQASAQPKLLWSSSKSVGIKKNDAKLRLALNDNNVFTADSSGMIRAQSIRTGDINWESKVGSVVSSGPTLIGEVVLVGTRDKELCAYHARNGQFLWRTALTGELLAAPRAQGGRVFLHTMDGSISAVDLTEGKLLWRQNLSTPPIMLRKAASPIVANNRVYVGFSNGRFLALRVEDGSIDWERELSVPKGRSDLQRMADISADPILHQGVIYVVGYQGHLSALKADSGDLLWERDLSSYSGLVLANNALFVADSKGKMWAIHKTSGKTIWEQEALVGRRLSTPEIYGNHVVVGDDDGFVHWLSPASGTLVDRIKVDSKGIEAPLVVRDQKLYVMGQGGKLAVYGMPARVQTAADTTSDAASIQNGSTNENGSTKSTLPVSDAGQN